jgi:hypothetical protein
MAQSSPDLAATHDLASSPDLEPEPVVCAQDCNLSVPNGANETIICELGQKCSVNCGAGAHCTVQCLGDAQCHCQGAGCTISDCAPVQHCKGGVIACNQSCMD